MRFSIRIMLAVSALLLAMPAAADSRPAEQVIVTATRLPEALDSTLASVTVIDRNQIESRQYLTFQEALASVPGIAISNNGGIGKGSFFLIRGAEADQNLVLVNGLRIGSTTLGTAAIQDLPLEQIDRIEIVRGPRSAIYGADALGGVVQIFTRRAQARDGLQSDFSVGSGTNSTHRASANFGQRSERGYWQFGASTLQSEGTNACAGFGFPIFVGCFTDEPDTDAYRNRSATLRGGLNLSDATTVELFGLMTTGRVEFDGSFGNLAEIDQLSAGASLEHRLGTRSTLRVQLGRATDDSENFDGTLSVSRFDTTRDTVSALLDTQLGAVTVLSLGLDYQRDAVDSALRYDEQSRRTVGAFTQLQWSYGASVLQASLRRDDNEQFGGETTGSVAWGYRLSPEWRATLSAGTGFKAPSFNELYFPGFGNAALTSETSLALESALHWQRQNTRASLTVYQNRVEDLIGIDANFSPINIDSSRTRGLELEFATRYRGFDLAGSAEWLDPENRSANVFDGNVLPRRARNLLRAEISRDLGPVRLGTRVHYAGARFDNLANTRRLGGYATFDLLADWRLQPRWRLQARAANLLDRDYQTAAFFPQPGRELHVTLRYAP